MSVPKDSSLKQGGINAAQMYYKSKLRFVMDMLDGIF
jgi:hypothetical protein